MFFITSAVAGLAAFFIFRRHTHPTAGALSWLLLLAFVASGFVCSVAFWAFCQCVRWRWVRLAAVPLFLAVFTFLSGLGVFGATRLVYDSRLRDADFGGVLYLETSGMQMLALNHDLWLYVIGSVALPLSLLSAVGAITAFTGSVRNGQAVTIVENGTTQTSKVAEGRGP